MCFILLLNTSHMLYPPFKFQSYADQHFGNSPILPQFGLFPFFCFFIFFHLPKKRILILQCLEQHMEEKLFFAENISCLSSLLMKPHFRKPWDNNSSYLGKPEHQSTQAYIWGYLKHQMWCSSILPSWTFTYILVPTILIPQLWSMWSGFTSNTMLFSINIYTYHKKPVQCIPTAKFSRCYGWWIYPYNAMSGVDYTSAL